MMWAAISNFALKALGALTAYFIALRGGKTAQRLKDAEKGLKQAGEAHEIDETIARMSDAELDKRLRESGEY